MNIRNSNNKLNVSNISFINKNHFNNNYSSSIQIHTHTEHNKNNK